MDRGDKGQRKKGEEKACIWFSVVVNYNTTGLSKVGLALECARANLDPKAKKLKENET